MIILLLSLTCPLTVFVGFEKGWTANDKLVYAGAKASCKKYYPDNPCVTKFVKTKKYQDYQVTCGEKR